MAEQRLIDAIPFEKYLCDEAKTFNVMATNTSRYELLKALKYVVKANVLTEIGQKMMDTPTVDAVEVVRIPVKGYENEYEVDQFGRVFSKDRVVHVIDGNREYDKSINGKQLRQAINSNGYKVVSLVKNGKQKSEYVHRLVANAFIPNHNNLPFVNHKDEDKTNNFVENLEWCTEQYNTNYGNARRKQAKALKGKPHTQEHKNKCSESLKKYYETHKSASIGRKSEKRKSIYAYNRNGSFIAWYPSIADASEATGAPRANITAVCNGKRKSANGIAFSFCYYGERKDGEQDGNV